MLHIFSNYWGNAIFPVLKLCISVCVLGPFDHDAAKFVGYIHAHDSREHRLSSFRARSGNYRTAPIELPATSQDYRNQ